MGYAFSLSENGLVAAAPQPSLSYLRTMEEIGLLLLGWVLGFASEIYKGIRDGTGRHDEARRLLAHHAATLIEDADIFLSTASRYADASAADVAKAFADAGTSSRVFRDQIADRVSALSDRLVDLFTELDVADSAATHATHTLQQRSARYFTPIIPVSGGPAGMGQAHPANLPRDLRDDLLATIDAFRSVSRAAFATLSQLATDGGDDTHWLPDRASRLLTTPPRHSLPPGNEPTTVDRG